MTSILLMNKEDQEISHIDPTFSHIAVLPLSELALLAESLLNLTILKKIEASRGTTDVALILKNEVFTWIKKLVQKEFDHQLIS